MKNVLISFCALPLLLAPLAEAGINGTYKVRGTETENGEKYTFTGTVVVSKYKSGKYALKFDDGDSATFTFKFSKPLKDVTTPQTVNGSSKLGTAKATFRFVQGQYKVNFTYKANGANVSGSGSGTK